MKNLTKDQIERLKDVKLDIVVELGNTTMKIQDILKLGKGEYIELDQEANLPVKIYAGKKLIALGEVVTVDENYGVRILEFISEK